MSGLRRGAHALLTMSLLAGAGCASLQAFASTRESTARTWTNTLAVAQSDANASRFSEADSVLDAFAAAHPGSTEALESSFWRGVFTMDPANPDRSLSAAMASLDSYLADPRAQTHVAEARTLRRLAGELSGVTRVAVNAQATARDLAATAAGAKAEAANANARAEAAKSTPDSDSDAEIKRLKSELAKANAELDRIRRRLAQPPPGKP